MKALKITRIVLVAVAAVLLGVSAVFAALPTEVMGVQTVITQFVPYFTLGVGTAFVLVVTGSIFLFSKNSTVRALGVGFTAVPYTVALTMLFVELTNIFGLFAAFGAIVYAVSWVFQLIMFIVRHADREDLDPDDDPKVQAVLRWKRLCDEKVITPEEYELKRVAILGLKKDKKEEK